MQRDNWSASRYEPDRTRAWHLSILCGQGIWAWAAHDKLNGEVVAMGWSDEVGVLDEAPAPTEPFTVSFVTLPEWSTLVPVGALEPGSEARHLAFVHGSLPTGALRDEPLTSLGASCIYVHDDEAERTILNRFPNARPIPMQALMVRAALARSSNLPVMLLHRGHDRADVAIASNGRILLSNSYPAQASQDMLYFALLAVEGAGLRPEDVEVRYGGMHITPHGRDLLHRYFLNEGPAIETWPDEPAWLEMGPSRWLAVLEQFPCVS